MELRFVRFILSLCFIAAGCLAVGCGDTEPPPFIGRDLGSATAPLPPPPGVWHDAAIEKAGQAEWHPFPPITPERLAESVAQGAARKKSARPAPAKGGGPEADVQRVIERYNGALAARKYEDVPKYFVERQQPNVADVLKTVELFLEKLRMLTDAIEEKAPDRSESLKALITAAEAQFAAPLKLESLTPVSESEMLGKVQPASSIPVPEPLLQVRFRRLNEEWQIEWAAMDASAGMIPTITSLLPQFDALIEGIRSGTIPADAAANQLGVLASALQASSGSNAADRSLGGDSEKRGNER